MLQQLLHGLIAQSADASSQGGGLSMFVPLILIVVVMYFLILRPQSQQAKKTAEFLSQLKKGDEVLLQNGIYGKIFEVRDTEMVVEIAQGVKVRAVKSAVTGPATAPAAKGSETKPEADKKA